MTVATGSHLLLDRFMERTERRSFLNPREWIEEHNRRKKLRSALKDWVAKQNVKYGEGSVHMVELDEDGEDIVDFLNTL